MKIFIYVIAAFLFLNTSCKSNKKTTATKETDKLVQQNSSISKHTKLLSGSHNNITKEDNLIIRSQAELEKIYTTINKTRRPGYSVPKIDFSKEIVIALFMGSKTSGGYSIKIDHIDFKPEETLVNIIKSKPSGMATSVMTQPFYIAKIPKMAKKIVFADLSENH